MKSTKITWPQLISKTKGKDGLVVIDVFPGAEEAKWIEQAITELHWGGVLTDWPKPESEKGLYKIEKRNKYSSYGYGSGYGYYGGDEWFGGKKIVAVNTFKVGDEVIEADEFIYKLYNHPEVFNVYTGTVKVKTVRELCAKIGVTIHKVTDVINQNIILDDGDKEVHYADYELVDEPLETHGLRLETEEDRKVEEAHEKFMTEGEDDETKGQGMEIPDDAEITVLPKKKGWGPGGMGEEGYRSQKYTKQSYRQPYVYTPPVKAKVPKPEEVFESIYIMFTDAGRKDIVMIFKSGLKIEQGNFSRMLGISEFERLSMFKSRHINDFRQKLKEMVLEGKSKEEIMKKIRLTHKGFGASIKSYTEGDKYWIDENGNVINAGFWHYGFIESNIDTLMKQYPKLKQYKKIIKETKEAIIDTDVELEIMNTMVWYGWIAVGIYPRDNYAQVKDESYIKTLKDVMWDKIKDNGGSIDVHILSNGSNKMVRLEDEVYARYLENTKKWLITPDGTLYNVKLEEEFGDFRQKLKEMVLEGKSKEEIMKLITAEGIDEEQLYSMIWDRVFFYYDNIDVKGKNTEWAKVYNELGKAIIDLETKLGGYQGEGSYKGTRAGVDNRDNIERMVDWLNQAIKKAEDMGLQDVVTDIKNILKLSETLLSLEQ